MRVLGERSAALTARQQRVKRAVMASSDIERRINRCTDDFVSDLERLIVEVAQACVRDALAKGLEIDLSAAMDWKMKSAQPSEAPKRARPAARADEEADDDAGDDDGGRRKKRSKQEVEAITDQLLAYIEENPGLRMGQISDGLGIPSGDLTLPMRNLVRENHLRTVGQKRATMYFAR